MIGITRRFVVSLRVMLLLVLACGLWLGWKANRAREQRRAIEAVRSHGGQVFFDWNEDTLLSSVKPEGKHPSAPRWARQLLGDEYFQEVTAVDFGFDFQHPGNHKKTPVP